MRINLEYKTRTCTDFSNNTQFVNISDRDWFISNIQYFQNLLCKENIYISLYSQLYNNIKNYKTNLTVLFLESFCKSATLIFYKLFGKSNTNNILVFKNKMIKLYKNNLINFFSQLDFTKAELNIIDKVADVRNKVYGHSDNGLSMTDIDDLMSQLDFMKIKPIIQKCMHYINSLWKSFCGEEITFELKDEDIMYDAFKNVIILI